jgi:MFS family permease
MSKRRNWIVLLAFVLVIINYMDRIALSIAAKPIEMEFNLSPAQMGYVFSSFLWAYVIFLVPVGMVVDRLGAKLVAGAGIALWSLATLLTGAASSLGFLMASRIVMGLGETTSFPAGTRILRDWVPQGERGMAVTLFNAGNSIGPAIGAIAVAWLIGLFGWRMSFVLLGVLGFVWLVVWTIWYGQPEKVTWLSDDERGEILAERDTVSVDAVSHEAPETPIFELLRQRTVWAMVLTHGCIVFTGYMFLTWMPTYIRSFGSLTMMQTGYATALPYVISVIFALVIARISDRVLSASAIRAGKRRYFIIGAALVTSLIVLAPLATNLAVQLGLLAVVLTGHATATGLNFALASDLLDNRRDISRVSSLVALGGNAFGAISPIVTGHIVSATGSYRWAFYTAGTLLVIGAIIMFTLVRSRITPGRPMSMRTVPC